ncbi:hypothetical protein BCL32_4330 [Rhizobium mongolense USDA 1844]|nr:hypothetical protein BCL32_4330 [Rhizobium mongolense USDA 1844]
MEKIAEEAAVEGPQSRLTLNEVHSVRATAEADSYVLFFNLTDFRGDTYDCEYCSRPDDPYGLNPVIRQWLTDKIKGDKLPPASHTSSSTAQLIPALLSPSNGYSVRFRLSVCTRAALTASLAKERSWRSPASMTMTRSSASSSIAAWSFCGL